MKKGLCFLLLTLMMCAMLSGCFNSTNQPVEDQSTQLPTGEPFVTTDPTAMVTPNASPSMGPEGQQGGQSGGQNGQQSSASANPFNWASQATAVEGRIDMFSEIQDCRIVTSDETALVGVKFTSQYQGEMTQRIRDMIAGEVMAADNSIQVVAVTAQPEDVTKIYELADKQRAGAGNQEIEDDVEKIARNATTLR